MNMIKTVLKKFGKDRAYMIVILFTTIFASCGGKHDVNKGFALEEFAIDNARLDSVIQSVFDNSTGSFPDIDSNTEKVLSLNFQSKDSAIVFAFSFSPKDELVNSIYRNNYRIVGYAEYGNHDVILLSDISHISDFGTLSAEFIHPTGNKKTFDYMVYPDNLYSCNGNGAWPSYEMIHDPIYLVYKYKEGKSLSPILTTNFGQNCENPDKRN